MAVTKAYHGKYKGVLVSKTNMRKFKEGLKTKMNDIIDFLVFRYSQIGEECVKIAREPHAHDYHDITGNLRSSIGYVILVDGKPVVGGNFAAVSVPAGKRKVKTPDGKVRTIYVGGDGSEGQKAGQDLLKTLQAKFPWGVVLIICAGMKYAAYVEAIHHKDVLTSAELKMESLAKELLKGIIE